MTKQQLLQRLQQASILMNEYGERLFADDLYTASAERYEVKTIELTVASLGFQQGAPLDQIFQRAGELGLSLCPLELGPYIRLQYLDQPEGLSAESQRHQAPSGSITIASAVLTDDHDFPKGFYLRSMDGALWLRGYIADYLHIWDPNDHFIFAEPSSGEKK
ncbi:helicase [Bacillus infantis]|uniref:helicase n=1 Tax=Bacillus infantis TaxID=324767 RepID=UPI001CD6DB0B|nr:helicase [Bacillus infantis]MCA1040030.1 helicase [Bacillus infantis]